MKSLKAQFIGAIAMVLVAAIAMGSSTYAWFAMNTTVTATNMKVTATAEGSLVITTGSLPTAATSATTVDIDDASATALLASTHDSTWATYATGLKTVSNPSDVSATTGLALDGETLTFVAAVNPASGTAYYKDYTVFIASSGTALTGQDLTATLIAPAAAVTTLPGATSIDFYYMTSSSTNNPTPADGTFAGTLNLAGLDPVTNNSTTTRTSVVMSDIDIPVADSNHGITIMMRVYIDGALKDSGTTTYIKTVDATEIADQTISVQFTATAHT